MKRCQKCGTTENLSKHSIHGGHKPPFIILCLDCHNRTHGTIHGRKDKRTQKGNLKNAKGTPRRKNK